MDDLYRNQPGFITIWATFIGGINERHKVQRKEHQYR